MIVNKTDLKPAVKRHIKDKENYLGKQCMLLWEFANYLDEKYLMGRFVNKEDKEDKEDKADETIVTLAIHNPYVCGGWEPQWR